MFSLIGYEKFTALIIAASTVAVHGCYLVNWYIECCFALSYQLNDSINDANVQMKMLLALLQRTVQEKGLSMQCSGESDLLYYVKTVLVQIYTLIKFRPKCIFACPVIIVSC